MSFRIKAGLLLFLILCDVFFTAIRPSWTAGGTVVRYILCSIHGLVIIMHAVNVFALFSGTIWFEAGLLRQLYFSIKATFPLWVFRFAVFSLPWVVDEFVSSSEFPWEYWLYGLLTCLNIISVCSLGVGLCFTLCALTDKTMYSPYHMDIGKEEREAIERINKGATPYDNAFQQPQLQFSSRSPSVGNPDLLAGSSVMNTPRLSVVRSPHQSGLMTRNDSITSMTSASGAANPPAAITGFKMPPLSLGGGTFSSRRQQQEGNVEAPTMSWGGVTEMTSIRRRRHPSGIPSTPDAAAGRTVTFHGEVGSVGPREAASLVENASFAY